MKIQDRMKLVSNENEINILLDDIPLFTIDTTYSTQHFYNHVVNNVITQEEIPYFEIEYLDIFTNDIIEQLENGVSRHDLTINIPRELKTIKIGDKILHI